MGDLGLEQSSVHRPAGPLPVMQFLSIACVFWLYVMFSDVVVSYSLKSSMPDANQTKLIASMVIRVLQHAILLPVLLAAYWVSLRIPWRPLWRGLPLQLALGLAFAALGYPALVLARAAWHPTGGPIMVAQPGDAWHSPSDLALWFATLIDFLFSYGFGLAMISGFTLYRRSRDAELQVVALERAWSAARLAALRMQLSPHTLFNWLHAIRGYIEWDPRAAQAMVVQLADLLRRLLSAGERDLSTLADELQFARSYLELQQRRFADRLSVELPQAGTAPTLAVPSLILQPLVENAVVHGLAGHLAPVHIRVTAEAGAGELRLCVSNDVGPQAEVRTEGIGLTNVRERLAVQYGGRARMDTALQGGRWAVWLTLPVQAA